MIEDARPPPQPEGPSREGPADINIYTYTVCLLEFHTRDRVLAHVMDKSKTWMDNLLYRGPIINEEEVVPSDSAGG